jgi:hypothetical protein
MIHMTWVGLPMYMRIDVGAAGPPPGMNTPPGNALTAGGKVAGACVLDPPWVELGAAGCVARKPRNAATAATMSSWTAVRSVGRRTAAVAMGQSSRGELPDAPKTFAER